MTLLAIATVAYSAFNISARTTTAPFPTAKTFLARQTVVAGKYAGEADVQPFGKLPISAQIRQTGDRFFGLLTTPMSDAAIMSGVLAGDKLTLIVDLGGDDIILSGTLSSARFSGTISSQIANGTFELRRIGDAEPETDSTPIVRQSKEKWLADLRFFQSEIINRHKNAFHRITREQFDRSVAELERQIPALTDDQIVFGMTRIAAQIGDGHTGLNWMRSYAQIPARFFWFGDELRVIQVGDQTPRANGARVAKIGVVPIQKIYERSRAYISQGESEQYVLEANAYLLTFPAFLQQIGASDNAAKAVFELVDRDGKKFRQEFAAVAPNNSVKWLYPYKNAPLYLRNSDKPLSFEYLKDAQTVYVNFRWYPRRAEFARFSNELFDFIDKNAVQKLVIDMRDNGGGDFTRGQDFIVNKIKARQQFLTAGRLYVIAGRRTFSAGMSNTAHLINQTNAIFVGEPTGARPIGYMENRIFALPNSHLNANVSTLLSKFADRDTPGILPAKLIAPDWRSFAAGCDAALEWILAQQPAQVRTESGSDRVNLNIRPVATALGSDR